ncbi:MAG TPA: hypothetical protein VM848_01970 [Acidimicrobiia bacterium]|nr:hypothetical protein [Acidimicrobiia bacterium]
MAIRLAASRLTKAAAEAFDVGNGLQDDGERVKESWSGKAQMLFGILTDSVGGLMTGVGDIATEFSAALARYSHTLEISQREVQIARERLHSPWGATYDPSAVATNLAQAERARANAEAAAHELSAKALDLMGGSSSMQAGIGIPGEANASFVSHAHSMTGSIAAGRQAAASFDASSAQLEQQFGSVLNALVPGPGKSIAVLPASSSPLSGPTAVALGPQMSTVENSIMIKPGTGTGAATVLLGPGGALTTAPGVVILSHGMGQPPASVAMIDINDPDGPALSQLKRILEAERMAVLAEYVEYLDSPEYIANLGRGGNSGIHNTIADSTNLSGIWDLQDWIQATGLTPYWPGPPANS